MQGFDTYADEREFVAGQIETLIADGLQPSEVAIFGKTRRLFSWFEKELRKRNIRASNVAGDGVFVSTMHGAKRLEFLIVFMVGCQQSQIPGKIGAGTAYDPEAKRQAFQRERNLLYVCMTRARKQA